jgi:uncharacterized protein
MNMNIVLFICNIYKEWYYYRYNILGKANMKKYCLILILSFCFITLLFTETVELKTNNGIIYGTLEIPSNDNVFPLVIIVAGSGPTDRNGNSPAGVFANSYKMLAEELLKNNIASLRYDKRGIGTSVNAGSKEEDLRFEDYVNDLISWVKQLKTDKRFNKLYIAGHSEGSLIGMIALQKEKCDGFISIAGAGRKISDVIIEQLTTNPNNPKNLIDESKRIIDNLLIGKTETNIPKVLDVLFRPSVQPYLISWFKYDPAIEIKKIVIPVLILQGTEDIQVSINDAEILAGANNKALFKKLSGVTHMLKEINNPSEQMSTYTDPNIPLSKELVKEIIEFVK